MKKEDEFPVQNREPIFVASGIHKSYDGKIVVNDIDLTLKQREVKVIVGPSGSGKSTVLRLVALLEPIDSGEILFKGRRLGVKKDRRGIERPCGETQLAKQRRPFGMVFQSFDLFAHLNALDNVTLGLKKVKGVKKSDANRLAMDVLRRVGLEDRSHAFPSELSGGQQQRVAIARALVMKPDILLFDEPTSALDPESIKEVLSVIEDLAFDGTTMLVVTHELSFARRAADSVVMFDNGRVVEEWPPETFFENCQEDATKRFLQAAD